MIIYTHKYTLEMNLMLPQKKGVRRFFLENNIYQSKDFIF